MYNPTLGRWMTEDPIGFDAGTTNFYGFVSNNPLNMVDPSRLSMIPSVMLSDCPTRWC